MKLTLKQKRFADEYIISGNATQAYIDAGYSAKRRTVAEANARKLLGHYSVKKYIDERLQELEEEKIADQKEVLQYLSSVLRGKSESEEIVVLGTGKGRSQAHKVMKAPSEKERLKAAELLGKRYGLFTEKVETTVAVEDLSPLSELLK